MTLQLFVPCRTQNIVQFDRVFLRFVTLFFQYRVMQGTVTCGSWIRRPENLNLVVLGKSSRKRESASRSVLEIFSFDPQTSSLSNSPQVTYVFEETEGEPVTIAVHPSGDDFVCSTSKGGCKLLELSGQETNLKLLAKELPPLQDAGPQNCMAFSVDGSKFATGGVDGLVRILKWPSLLIILDEAKAHNSVRDMDFSLDSEFLASTSTDGAARIWKAEDGLAVATLTRNSDEKIELCRFSKDGTKPFLFCAVQKGDKAVTSVYDISTWKKIGYKRLLRKPAAIMSISLDGKYLALGSKDGDVCVAEVKTMEVSHLSRRLHLGTCITSLEFCPSQRVVLTTSNEWGAVVTKLNVPADWKEWQIYLVLVGLFLASAVAFYIFFQKSDSFWKFPLGRDQPGRPKFEILDPQYSEDAFGPLDM
ncbi:PREDICTED: SEC12-like protein 1 isoform X1 [Populus euphratica]|uniref:SEC12-like protein 1 isoform X1 n=2 Tax=Populus euphratica TaxID=75702 RepID=A0AAJ6U7C1_POPEU|nr:PREDICTED: SEC12-like protein 1 isoform X1 [Populus euphratica]